MKCETKRNTFSLPLCTHAEHRRAQSMSCGILVITIGVILIMIIVIVIRSVVVVVLLISIRSCRVCICRCQRLVALKNRTRRSTKGHRGRRKSIGLLGAEGVVVVAPVEIVASASEWKRKETTLFCFFSRIENERNGKLHNGERKKARKHTRADFTWKNQQETMKKEAKREINENTSYLRVDGETRTQKRERRFSVGFVSFRLSIGHRKTLNNKSKKNRCICE